MKYANMAKSIISAVGGESNVSSLVHCATRLRFKLIDKSIVSKEEVEKIPGVISVVESGGQFQIVIGNAVGDVFSEIGKITNLTNEASNTENEAASGNLFERAIDIISGIFTPLLGALAGGGMIKGLLMICTTFNWLSDSSGTYQILFAAADSIFYFLPLLLAYTSAKKFQCNPAIAMTAAGALIYPSMLTLFQEGASVTFLGIPVVLMNYTSSVIPIILAVFVLSKLEKFFNAHIHEVAKTILTPMLCLLIVVPLTFLAFGPFGTMLSQGIGNAYSFVYNLSPIFAGALVGALWQVFVIFGVHWGLVPIMLNNIATTGFDTMSAMLAPSNFSQAGASLGVFLKTKKPEVKAIAGSAALTGFFGITEPSIYGVTLRYKKPFVIAGISGAIGGAIVGISGATTSASAIPGILTLPVYIGKGFGLFLVGTFTAYILSAVGTYLFGYKDEADVDTANETNKSTTSEVIVSPLNGSLMKLSDVQDEAFSSGALGSGIAIIPLSGKLISPVDGVATVVFPTGHAIGLTSNSGTEILIHIGFDTVQLDGKFFNVKIKAGDTVKQGDTLVEFNLEKIQESGYDITTPVVITNGDNCKEITITEEKNIEYRDTLFEVQPSLEV